MVSKWWLGRWLVTFGCLVCVDTILALDDTLAGYVVACTHMFTPYRCRMYRTGARALGDQASSHALCID